VLRDFVYRRGKPVAIEVRSGVVSSTQLVLYYPVQREAYTFERSDGAWGLVAEEAITPDLTAQLQKELTASGLTFSGTSTEVAARRSVHVDQNRARFSGVKPADPAIKPNLPTESKDDLKIRVTKPGDTLMGISRRYTGSPHNVGAIAKANGISPTKGLQLGQTLIIPAKLRKDKTGSRSTK